MNTSHVVFKATDSSTHTSRVGLVAMYQGMSPMQNDTVKQKLKVDKNVQRPVKLDYPDQGLAPAPGGPFRKYRGGPTNNGPGCWHLH